MTELQMSCPHSHISEMVCADCGYQIPIFPKKGITICSCLFALIFIFFSAPMCWTDWWGATKLIGLITLAVTAIYIPSFTLLVFSELRGKHKKYQKLILHNCFRIAFCVLAGWWIGAGLALISLELARRTDFFRVIGF